MATRSTCWHLLHWQVLVQTLRISINVISSQPITVTSGPWYPGTRVFGALRNPVSVLWSEPATKALQRAWGTQAARRHCSTRAAAPPHSQP
eukprot:3096709-Rhodomonas_salina.1